MKIWYLSRQAKVRMIRDFSLIFWVLSMFQDVQAYYFEAPKGFCRLAASSAVSSEMLQLVETAIFDRLSLKCDLSDRKWGVAQDEINKMTLSERRRTPFFFKVELDAVTGDLVVRALEGESGWQWGIVSARVDGLSASSQRAVLEDSIRRLIEQFPFLGFIDGETFFTWAEEEAKGLQLMRIQDRRLHPFLPAILTFQTEPAARGGWRLERSSEKWSLVAPSSPKLKKGDQGRLWLGRRGR